MGQDTSCALFPLSSVKRCSQRLHAHLPHRVFVCVASSTILHAQRLSPVPNPKHSQLQTAPHLSVNKIWGFCFRYKPCTLLSAYLLVLTSPVIGTRSGNGGEIPGQHGVWMWMKCLVQPLRQTWHRVREEVAGIGSGWFYCDTSMLTYVSSSLGCSLLLW